MDHPRVLRHPADCEPVAHDGGHRFLQARVGGHDRLGRIGPAVHRERRQRQGRASSGRSRFSGSRAPITPVERTSTSSASAGREAAQLRPRSRGRRAFRVRRSRRSATPELITTACGSASARCSRLIWRQAAWTRLRVKTAAPTARGSERTIARSFRSRRLIPAATPECATNPLAAVTLIPAPAPAPPGASAHQRAPSSLRSYQHAPGAAIRPSPGRPSARFAFWTACPAAPLPRLSIGGDHDRLSGRPVGVDGKLGGVSSLEPSKLGIDSLRKHAHDGASRRSTPLDEPANIGLGAEVNRSRAAPGAPAAGAGRR